jgi:isopenicillin N synthase-like dioxygenase
MAPTTEVPRRVEWNGKQVPVYPMQTIDFSAILSQEPEEIEKLLQCCKDEGFFYLDLNNVDGRRFLDDHQELLKLMHRFFESPLEVKNEYGLIAPHLGYEDQVLFDSLHTYSQLSDTSQSAPAMAFLRTPGTATRWSRSRVTRSSASLLIFPGTSRTAVT